MPGKGYTPAQRAEAVALASVIGAEAAGQQLAIPWRSIRRWSEQAGNAPELAAPSGSWAELMRLAIARTTAAVAGGKLNATTVATIAGIAARNQHRDPVVESKPGEDRWFAEWVASIRPDLDPDDVLHALLEEDHLRREEAGTSDDAV